MCEPSEVSNLVLIGFMGCGKSTVGRELARQSGFRLIDLDQLVVRRCGRSIQEIFAAEGENRFRSCETEALQSLGGLRQAVVATGGGIIGREENWHLMRGLGPVIYLRANWKTLRSRLTGSQGRPLADDEDWSRLHALWRNREPLYARADLTVDTDNREPGEVAHDILAILGKKLREDREECKRS